MAIDRWDPFREMLSLRDTMDRMMQESFLRPTSAMLNAARGGFPLDIAETEQGFTVQASLPGVRPDDVHVQVEGNTLTIRGERKAQAEDHPEGGQWLMREHRAETFFRSVTLPAPINADQAQASYEHGILTLTLPKAESAKPKQIKVSGAATSGQLSPSSAQVNNSGQEQNADATARHADGSVDQVTEASQESFPSSDPPAYGGSD